MTSDFGMNVIAFKNLEPAKIYSGSSAEEAVGKLFFSEQGTLMSKTGTKPMMAVGSSFQELGAGVLQNIATQKLDMSVEYLSVDGVV